MSEETPSRITVSRDALRADLAEMELRLRVYFDDRLRMKADQHLFLEVSTKLDRLDRGEWTAVHRRALMELIEEAGATADDRQWTRRERMQGALAGLVASAAFMLSLILALRGGQL